MGLCFFLVVLISAGGWFYYQYQATQAREAARESLATIADLKAEEISNWLRERQGDAEVVRTSLVAKELMANPNSPEAREAAVMRAKIFRKIYGYAAVVFADAQGRVQLKVPADYPLSDVSLNKHVQVALHSQTVQIADLNRDTTNAPILMWLECPIFTDFQTNGPRAGAVILVIDPHTFLYPTIDKWPAPSQTAETVIARREGDEVVRLNNRRFGTNSALNVRASITANPQRPMVLAAQSIQGVTEGVDYRGKSVFMATRKITGMPWFMVAMIDQEEVLAPFRKEAWNVGIITILLLVASMLGIGLLWRRQKFADARTSETRLQALIEQAPLAISISREGKSIYANQKFLNYYGYKNVEDIVGQSILVHWSPEFRGLIKERVRKRAQGEPVSPNYEGMAQRKDGSQFPVAIAVASVELPDGHANMAFIADITERRQAEKTQKQMAEIVNSSEDAIISKTLDGIITSWNPGAEKMFGYSAAEAVGQPMLIAFPPELLDEEKEILAKIKRGEVLKHYETVRVRKDGKKLNVSVTISPIIDINGEIIGASKIARDITERKRAEEALARQMVEVRFRNEELQRFTIASTERELRSIELKQEINELCRQLGKPLKYRVDFAEPESKDKHE